MKKDIKSKRQEMLDDALEGMTALQKKNYNIIDTHVVDDYDTIGEKVEKKTAAYHIEQMFIEEVKKMNSAFDIMCNGILYKPKNCNLSKDFRTKGCGKCGSGSSSECVGAK